jgi:hypothetical protein
MNTINILREIALKNAFAIYIPSLGRDVKFIPLNIAQQRQIYESASDNLAFQTKFVITTYEIIKNNCLESEVVNQLNVVDRASVLIALRKNLFNTNIAATENGNIDLNLVQEKIKNTNCNLFKDSIQVGDLLFKIQVPNIFNWYVIEKELRSGPEVPKTFVKIFSEIYATELLKLIKEIYYKTENGEYTPVLFEEKTTQEKIQAINSLPAESSFQLKDALIKYYDYYMDLLTVVTDENISLILDIRADFFIE